MNDFYIFEKLLSLEKIAIQYPDGADYSKRIRQCADKITSQHYCVAVIGEFKRGKSSLINALLGAEILPTSVLPMTAAITRIHYGTEKRILISYKDGDTEESTIDQLIEYTTKYDAEKAERASSIQEVLVYYPSVFCKNHIEIIDTPGLNDNEAMSAVTLSICGEIDAAIVVISGLEPLSMTEQDLIISIISQQNVHHIVFAITYLDAVSKRSSEQDRIISFITGRIQNEVLEKAQENFSDNILLYQKATEILSDPKVFGVSSLLAMRGFDLDDDTLLQQSRFPVFKKELLDLLTAAQSSDILLNTRDFALEIKKQLQAWHQNEFERLTQQKNQMEKALETYIRFFSEGEAIFQRLINDVQDAVSHYNDLMFVSASKQQKFIAKPTYSFTKSSGIQNALCRVADESRACFIKHLTSVTVDTNTEEVLRTILDDAVQETNEIWTGCSHTVKTFIQLQMQTFYKTFWSLRPDYPEDESENDLHTAMQMQAGEWHSSHSIPTLLWNEVLYSNDQTLCNSELIPHVKKGIISSIVSYTDQITSFVNDWISMLQLIAQKMFSSRQIMVLLERKSIEIGTRLMMLNTLYPEYEAEAERISYTLMQMKTEESEEKCLNGNQSQN